MEYYSSEYYSVLLFILFSHKNERILPFSKTEIDSEGFKWNKSNKNKCNMILHSQSNFKKTHSKGLMIVRGSR